jgi:hypothetical protein
MLHACAPEKVLRPSRHAAYAVRREGPAGCRPPSAAAGTFRLASCNGPVHGSAQRTGAKSGDSQDHLALNVLALESPLRFGGLVQRIDRHHVRPDAAPIDPGATVSGASTETTTHPSSAAVRTFPGPQLSEKRTRIRRHGCGERPALRRPPSVGDTRASAHQEFPADPVRPVARSRHHPGPTFRAVGPIPEGPL